MCEDAERLTHYGGFAPRGYSAVDTSLALLSPAATTTAAAVFRSCDLNPREKMPITQYRGRRRRRSRDFSRFRYCAARAPTAPVVVQASS